jgi:hypothetical protein
VSDCACSRGCLPAQAIAQKPDQHDRQRDLCWTDGASSTVRRRAVWFLVILGHESRFLVVAWMRGPFSPGFLRPCFLVTMACSPHFCLLHKLLFFSAHDLMLSTHRFILSSVLVFEYGCVYLGLGVCVCVCASMHICGGCWIS